MRKNAMKDAGAGKATSDTFPTLKREKLTGLRAAALIARLKFERSIVQSSQPVTTTARTAEGEVEEKTRTRSLQNGTGFPRLPLTPELPESNNITVIRRRGYTCKI